MTNPRSLPRRLLLLFLKLMTDKSEENASITLGSSNMAEPASVDSMSPASSHFMHTVLWALLPEINHLIVPEDPLRHKLDTWHASDLNLTRASTGRYDCFFLRGIVYYIHARFHARRICYPHPHIPRHCRNHRSKYGNNTRPPMKSSTD